MTSKQTSLFSFHQELKAKMAPFAGYDMPIFYKSVLTEHHHVRNHVGIFDISHMGEVFVSGKDALNFLQYLTINDVSKLGLNQGQYTAICNERGGMIDDLIIYHIDQETYLLCVNASNIDKDFQWIQKQAVKFANVHVVNQSHNWSQIAVQGPQSLALINEVFENDYSGLPYMSLQKINLSSTAFLARTGYTGEKGFEIYLSHEDAPELWQRLLEHTALNPSPIGLGARDTLRLESCYLLYGQDMDENTTPLEADIAWATKLRKTAFIGQEALLAQRSNGLQKRIFAFKMQGDGIPRHGMTVQDEAQKILGVVTSGGVCPTVGGSGGLVMLSPHFKEGDEFFVDVRGKLKSAKVTKKPHYQARIKS